MFLSKSFNPFARPKQSKVSGRIYPAKKFRIILEHEQARADRNRHRFSLLVFDSSGFGSDNNRVQCLTRTLANRIRSIDEAGWLDNERIGVLLPYTKADGAWKLAGDVCRVVGVKASPPVCTVYTYPLREFSDDDNDSDQGSHERVYPEQRPTEAGEAFSSAEHIAGDPSAFSTELPRSYSECRGKNMDEVLSPLFLHPLPMWKRAMDIVGATIAIIVFSPIMIAVVIAIKLTSKGPVVFRQQRAGLGGKPFTFYKFRSMVIDAEARKESLMKYNERRGPAFKMNNDPRVTRVGNFIRKWSLDELPQLFNVLRGELSLVGPRPLLIDEASQLNRWQDRRLYVTPGITCLWQVYARHDASFNRWARLDLRYIMRRSLLLDLKILIKTIPAVLLQKGAC